MTDNPNKKTFWDKVHLDPTMLLILLALLVYSALVIWSASGQDIGMMERKIGQIAMGLVIMVVMAQIPPRVYEGWAPYLYIICIILLVAVDAFGAISKGAQRWLDLGIVRFQPSEIAKIAVPLMVARFINRDVCPPSLKNTGIALVLIKLISRKKAKTTAGRWQPGESTIQALRYRKRKGRSSPGPSNLFFTGKIRPL